MLSLIGEIEEQKGRTRKVQVGEVDDEAEADRSGWAERSAEHRQRD